MGYSAYVEYHKISRLLPDEHYDYAPDSKLGVGKHTEVGEEMSQQTVARSVDEKPDICHGHHGQHCRIEE